MIEHFFKIFLKFIVKGYDKQFDLDASRHVLKFLTAIFVLIGTNDYSVYLDSFYQQFYNI